MRCCRWSSVSWRPTDIPRITEIPDTRHSPRRIPQVLRRCVRTVGRWHPRAKFRFRPALRRGFAHWGAIWSAEQSPDSRVEYRNPADSRQSGRRSAGPGARHPKVDDRTEPRRSSLLSAALDITSVLLPRAIVPSRARRASRSLVPDSGPVWSRPGASSSGVDVTPYAGFLPASGLLSPGLKLARIPDRAHSERISGRRPLDRESLLCGRPSAGHATTSPGTTARFHRRDSVYRPFADRAIPAAVLHSQQWNRAVHILCPGVIDQRTEPHHFPATLQALTSKRA
jgi:hypothetical protein